MAKKRKDYRSRDRIIEIKRIVDTIDFGIRSGEHHRLDFEEQIDERIAPDLRIIEDYLALTAERLGETLRMEVENGLDRP